MAMPSLHGGVADRVPGQSHSDSRCHLHDDGAMSIAPGSRAQPRLETRCMTNRNHTPAGKEVQNKQNE